MQGYSVGQAPLNGYMVASLKLKDILTKLRMHLMVVIEGLQLVSFWLWNNRDLKKEHMVNFYDNLRRWTKMVVKIRLFCFCLIF